jgi:hypothetical protein
MFDPPNEIVQAASLYLLRGNEMPLGPFKRHQRDRRRVLEALWRKSQRSTDHGDR